MSLKDFIKEGGKDPFGWHPDWEPEVGWQSKTNPTGWRRPARPAQQRELYLWDQWKKQDESPEAMSPLLQSLKPLVYRYGVQQFANRVPIHQHVLEAEARRLAIQGLRKYDPTKAQINTFLKPQLQSTNRFVRKRQNMSRITEDRIGKIGNMDRAIARLKDKLGREPTLHELADEMKESPDTLEKLIAERKDDRLSSGALEDPFLTETPKSRSVLRLIRYELTPNEQLVFDYLTGQNGKPLITSTGQIARKLGWGDSKVSQIKTAITRKIKKYL
jgi:DNA-directed RNA polymerase specialized sigma subunit